MFILLWVAKLSRQWKFWSIMLNSSTIKLHHAHYPNSKKGIILVFSCSMFIFSTKTCFLIEQWQKLVRFQTSVAILRTNLLAGNDHVIDIFTSEDMENISLCIFRYLTVYYTINQFIIWMLVKYCKKAIAIIAVMPIPITDNFLRVVYYTRMRLLVFPNKNK